MKQLIDLLKLNEKDLKDTLYKYLRKKNMSPIFEDGFLYAEGDIPILLVAHMDTVFEKKPKKLYYSKIDDKIFSNEGGIGGDDRCGVYAIMKLLETYRPHVLFTEDEEIGCIGAEKAVNKLQKPNVKYIIEFDRRGSNDCVFYDCGNENFMNYVESFGFVTTYGSHSDISVLAKAWDIAAVNLSSGYYKEHTRDEYIIFDELQNNIERAKLMLDDYTKVPYFDYQEIKYTKKPSYKVPNTFTIEDLAWLFGVPYIDIDNYSQQETEKKLILKKEKNPNNNLDKNSEKK